MNWGKLRSPIRATLTNPSFQSFCKLYKSLMYSLTPTFKNLRMNWKMLCPNLNFTAENKGYLHKTRLVTFQT